MALDTNLISWWKMEGNSNDAVGSNDGTDTDITYPAGKINEGAQGAETTSKIEAIFAYQPTSFSVAFWLYPTSLTNYNQRIEAINTWGSFVFHTTATGAVYCGTDIDTRWTPINLPADTLIIDTWHFIVYTYDGTYGRFYKNGSLLEGPKAQDSPSAWGGFQMGGDDVAHSLAGKADEVGIWSRALTSDEISEIYNSGDGITYPFLPKGNTIFLSNNF